MPSSRATGAELIAAERRRQVEEEGYSAEHDAEHADGSLSAAAVCYASDEPVYILEEGANGFFFKDPWPWEQRFDKRPSKGNVTLYKWSPAERLALLVKAGALIAAEIDLLQSRPYFDDPKTVLVCGGPEDG